MFTNTFTPHVGGVARSVTVLRHALERRGNAVMVVAPRYEGHEADADGVVRVPALSDFAGSGYALPIPLARHIRDEIEDFGPDVIHAHHPFLLGGTALRTAASLGVPAAFTYHTRYDLYMRRLTGIDGRLPDLAARLAAGFCDLADAVIAPSDSVRAMLRKHGVKAPVRVIPTGIEAEHFANGDGGGMRRRLGIPSDAFVVGHLGRLSEEKNLPFLSEAVCAFLARRNDAHFILAGRGPMREALDAVFAAHGVADRVHTQEILAGGDLAAFYAAMDVFAFASVSETQGLVLVEAMAAGRPVVALDAPGAREAVRDGVNGRLLDAAADGAAFADALESIAALPPRGQERMQAAARATARDFCPDRMAGRVEALYGWIIERRGARRRPPLGELERALDGLRAEGALFENAISALGSALLARHAMAGP